MNEEENNKRVSQEQAEALWFLDRNPCQYCDSSESCSDCGDYGNFKLSEDW